MGEYPDAFVEHIDLPARKPNDNGADRRPNGADDGRQVDHIVLSSREFVADFVPPDYLVKGIVQRRFFYSLTARTGGGKTAVALLLSACVALGVPFAGDRVSHGRVLYLAGENPDDLRMRWIAMGERMGFDVDEIAVSFIPGKFRIPALFDRIRDEVDNLGGVVLVIVDTSAVYFEGDQENDNVQLGDHARLLRSLVTLHGGPTVLALCHPVKNAASDNLLPRGGGSYLSEVDGNLTAHKKADTLIELHWQGKFRGPDFAPLSFSISTVTSQKLKDSDGDLIPTVLVEALSEADEQKLQAAAKGDEDRLLVAILSEKSSSLAAMAEACGWFMKSGDPYKMKVTRILKQLRQSKLVEKERDGWTLTSKGQKAAEKAKLNLDLAGARYD